MTSISDESHSLIELPGPTCPVCGGTAVSPPPSQDIPINTSLLRCQSCGHIWLPDLALQLSKSSGQESTYPLAPGQPASLSSVPLPAKELSESPGSFVNTKVMIPLPLFWGIVVITVASMGAAVWLFSELQHQKQIDQASEIALASRATREAEYLATSTQQAANLRATSTAEMRLAQGATATVAQAGAVVAATSTAERKATGTAESVATVNAAGTVMAVQVATATAERMATLSIAGTATAIRAATATAENILTASAQKTATAENRATATAAAVAAINAQATSTAEWVQTATAEWQGTVTAQQTAVAANSTAIAQKPELNVHIWSCQTGFDVENLMGEVVNTWVTVQNWGTADATDLTITLSAPGEGKPHPDKTKILHILAKEKEVSYKLTVDVPEFSSPAVEVWVTTAQGVTGKNTQACGVIDEEMMGAVLEKVGLMAVVRAARRF